jgi:hypothetical protein
VPPADGRARLADEGLGVVAFQAANGDLLAGVIAWQYDSEDHSLSLEIYWRDAVTVSDGATVASTGRFVKHRPPGIIAILIG